MTKQRSSDIVLMNANIITMDPALPSAEMVVIQNGQLIFVGDSEYLDEYKKNTKRVIDCRGKTIVPGFIDAHCHFFSLAESYELCSFNPKDVHSISDILKRIRDYAQEKPEGTWIKARGYDEFYLKENRHPSSRDLDLASTRHPIKLTHRSGHAHVLNTLAMSLAGISTDISEPPGTIFERDLSTGEPNGLLLGMSDFLSNIELLITDAELTAGVIQASRDIISYGITSINDASFQNDIHSLELFNEWKKNGYLKNNVSMMLGFNSFILNKDKDVFNNDNIKHTRLSGVKIILVETTGELHPSQAELNEMVLEVHRSGLQVAIHAVEETAIEAACDAIEFSLKKIPRSDHRHRIEHCSVCPPNLALRIASLGIMVVTQPPFLYYNGERYIRTVPDWQFKHLYPMATLISNGVDLAGSSDFPIVPVNPIFGIYSAVTRKSETDEVILSTECITPFDALRMYTKSAAKAACEESIKGSITPGKQADLVVLSCDPTKIEPEEIKNIVVELTMIKGDIVFGRIN